MTASAEDYSDFDDVNNERLEQIARLLTDLQVIAVQLDEDYAEGLNDSLGCSVTSADAHNGLRSTVSLDVERTSQTFYYDKEANCLAHDYIETFTVESYLVQEGLRADTMPVALLDYLTVAEDEDCEADYEATELQTPSIGYAAGIAVQAMVTTSGKFTFSISLNLHVKNEDQDESDVIDIPFGVAARIEPVTKPLQTEDDFLKSVFSETELQAFKSTTVAIEGEYDIAVVLRKFHERLQAIGPPEPRAAYAATLRIARRLLQDAN